LAVFVTYKSISYGFIPLEKRKRVESLLDPFLSSIEKSFRSDKFKLQVVPRAIGAEVKVGKYRIIEFFIYPFIKYLDEGISVR